MRDSDHQQVADHCDRCGRPRRDADHDGCAAARTLEPPRFCSACARRLVVQVTPSGWSARCSVHGTTASPAASV